MVSSLIIGSEAAILVDMPLAIPEAKELAAWVKSKTDKPLVAVFTTHFHPDHYLSGGAFLDFFPSAKYYTYSHAVEHIKAEAPIQAPRWRATFGDDNIVLNTTLPTPYDFTFFTLPGDESTPIQLLSPLGGDTADETLFWMPSIKTLIAGHTVYGHGVHLWLADMRTPALTSSWLSTIDFITYFKPATIICGHAVTDSGVTSPKNLPYARSYIEFWQKNIESKGADFFTPEEIVTIFNKTFPGLLSNFISETLLNITAEQFRRNVTRQYRGVDLTEFDDVKVLEAWRYNSSRDTLVGFQCTRRYKWTSMKQVHWKLLLV